MVERVKDNKSKETYNDNTEFVIVDRGDGKYSVEAKKGHFGTTMIKTKTKSLFDKLMPSKKE